MSRRARGCVLAFALLVVLVEAGGAARAEPAWAEKTCQIDRESEISFPHHPYLTCAAAKSILLRLKGRHSVVPMACHRTRTIMGWHIRATTKVPSGMTSTYTRGRYSFQYSRLATPAHSCPPDEGDEPDA
jgi:hypothetical protein